MNRAWKWAAILLGGWLAGCASYERQAANDPGATATAMGHGLKAMLQVVSEPPLQVGRPIKVRLTIENPGVMPQKVDVYALNTQNLDLGGEAAEQTYRTVDGLQHGEAVLYQGLSISREVDLTRYFNGFNAGKLELAWTYDTIASEPVVVAVREDYSRLRAKIETSMGDMTLKLYPEKAPETVAKFVENIRKGFYDGTTFHRIIKDFVIQGGDPMGTGETDVGYTLPLETSDLENVVGAVGVARAVDPAVTSAPAMDLRNQGVEVLERSAYLNSGASQFYICLAPQPHLNGLHTIFAQVIDGLDVLQRIGSVETTGKDDPRPYRPLEDVIIKKIELVPAEPGQ